MALSENLTGSGDAGGFRIAPRPLAARLPNAQFLVSPRPDRVLRHIIGEAKKSHPAVRAIPVAGHARRRSRELPLVLGRDAEFSKNR
jgi:hypothetical protein